MRERSAFDARHAGNRARVFTFSIGLRALGYVGLALFTGLFCVVCVDMIRGDEPKEGWSNEALVSVGGFFTLLFAYYSWRVSARLTTTADGVSCQLPFCRPHTLRWEDIAQFIEHPVTQRIQLRDTFGHRIVVEQQIADFRELLEIILLSVQPSAIVGDERRQGRDGIDALLPRKCSLARRVTGFFLFSGVVFSVGAIRFLWIKLVQDPDVPWENVWVPLLMGVGCVAVPLVIRQTIIVEQGFLIRWSLFRRYRIPLEQITDVTVTVGSMHYEGGFNVLIGLRVEFGRDERFTTMMLQGGILALYLVLVAAIESQRKRVGLPKIVFRNPVRLDK